MQLFANLNSGKDRTHTRTLLLRYGSACVLVALALLATLALPDIRNGTPFLFFFPVVILSTVIGGIGPGLLALALATGAVELWVRPDTALLLPDRGQPVQTVAFVVVMLIIIALIEALRLSLARRDNERELLRMTLASIGDAAIVTDAAGIITWINDVAAKLTGWPAADILGLPIDAVYQTVTEGTHSPLANPVHVVLKEQRVVESSTPVLLLARGGREYNVDSTAAPIRNRNGTTAGVILVFRDITQRRQAEAMLHASEKRFRIAQEISLDGFMILHAVHGSDGATVDFRWQYLNPAAARMLGNSREWFADKLLLDVLPGIKQQGDLFARLVTVLETGQPHDIEVFYDADGLRGWFRSMVVKLDDGLAVSFGDITDRKQYEQQLSYQAFILENVSDAIFAVDRDLNITLWNHGAEALYSWKAEEVLGRPVADVVRTNATPEQGAARFAAVAAGEKRSYELVHHNRQGQQVYVDSVASPLLSSDGSILGYVIINRDMTERTSYEQELVRLNASLEERIRERTANLERSNRELDRFAYIASHDLKAPLRAVANLAKWIEEDGAGALPPTSREHLAKLNARVRRMDKLLDDLLTYSRAGRMRHPLESVDTLLLVQETVEFLNLPPRFVEVAGRLPAIYTERVPLETVFRNLIQNAYKHHDRPDAGCVRVSAQESEHAIVFTFADDGPGIAPQYHERIFEIFQTLKPRDQVEGSGIGLTIVKKIVESRGGSLGLESAVGAGTTFVVTWPKQAAAIRDEAANGEATND